MAPTVESLGIDRLTRDQRLGLVQEIWESIADEPSTPPLDEAFCRELDRRIAEDDAAPDDAIPWEDVKREALDQLRSLRRQFQHLTMASP